MSTIGYIRAVNDEDVNAQQAKLKNAGCTEYFTDKAGLREAQPELENLLKYIRSGDTIMVTELSCIARNTAALVKLVGKLESKGVTFISLQDSINTDEPSCCFYKTV